MYASVALMAVCMLLTRNATLGAAWVVMTVLVSLRIPHEEAALVDLFARSKPNYTTYAKSCRWRMVPGG